MDSKQRTAWNSRPVTVTVLDRCDECGTLKPDVKKRQHYWPAVTAQCCSQCFTRLIGEAQGYAAC